LTSPPSKDAEPRVQEIKLDDIKMQRDQLKKHFKEEMKVKQSVKDYEKEIEQQNLSLQNKRAELNVIVKEKGAGNIQVKIINEEIDEVNMKIGGLKVKLKEDQNKFHELQQRRDMYLKAWKQDRTLRDVHVEVLQLMLNESITMIENMEIDTKY
jgi:uncharacterized coiled-coil DUF342 family protein